MQEALRSAPETDPRLRTTALLHGGLLLTFKGDDERSTSLLEEAHAHAQQHQDSQGIAESLAYLSMRAAFAGEWTESVRLLHDATAYWQRQADHHEIGFALRYLGVASFLQQQYQEAASLYTHAVERLTAIGDERTAGLALLYLALSVRELGDVPRAVTIMRDGIGVSLTFQDQRLLSLGVDAALNKRFRFCPLAVSNASIFTFWSRRNRNRLIPCHCLASPKSGSTQTLRLRIAFC